MFGVGNLGAGFGQVGGGPSGPVSIATNSLIFTAASSQFLSATGKVTLNQQKFTFATWFKYTAAGTNQFLMAFGDGTTNNQIQVSLRTTGVIRFVALAAAATVVSVPTTATFTDANWHHLVVAVDTTQAVAANSVLIYVDGTLQAVSSPTYAAQNTNLLNNFAAQYMIGGQAGPTLLLNGKLAQVYYIDGQQLTPSSFITGTPGVPKTYSGTYAGAFDFFLPFSNGASTTTLGADGSGEGNNWTLNAMTTANQSTDHP